MDKIIQKRSSPHSQLLRHVRDGKNKSLIFCEGFKLVGEALGSSYETRSLFCLKGLEKKIQGILKSKKKSKIPIFSLTKDVMNFVSDLSTPPGVIALLHRPQNNSSVWNSSIDSPLHLILHQIQSPQNTGTLIRTAEGAGVRCVWVTKQSADPFGPKALRASAGSFLRVPIQVELSLPDIAKELKTHHIRIGAAIQKGSIPYDRYSWAQPSALVLGSEGSGFNNDELNLFDDTLQIPMMGALESLNVAAAGAICLFEASRQRRVHTKTA